MIININNSHLDNCERIIDRYVLYIFLLEYIVINIFCFCKYYLLLFTLIKK